MNLDRRKFFTKMRWAGTALALAGPNLGSDNFSFTRQQILDELSRLKEGLGQIDHETLREEIAALKEAYQSLDSRTKWTLRVLLALSGLDILLSLE